VMHPLSVFVAYQFESPHIKKDDRDKAIASAIRKTNENLRRRHPHHEITWAGFGLRSGEHIGTQLVETIADCDIFVADLSEFNLNVVFELGVAYGLQRSTAKKFSITYGLKQQTLKKLLWLAHESVDWRTFPADLSGLYFVPYGKEPFADVLATRIPELCLALIEERQEADALRTLRKFWNLSAVSSTDIVCSEIPDDVRSPFASADNANYIRYAAFADLDSFINLKTRIAEISPGEIIREYLPREYRVSNHDKLIVIGGPVWNPVAKNMQRRLPFYFESAPNDQDSPLIVENAKRRRLPPVRKNDRKRTLLRDISVFARLGSTKMVSGCLTFGGLSASKCFIDREIGASNVSYIEERVDGADFVVVYEAHLTGLTGDVSTPNFSDHEPLILMKRDKRSDNFSMVLDNSETAESR